MLRRHAARRRPLPRRGTHASACSTTVFCWLDPRVLPQTEAADLVERFAAQEADEPGQGQKDVDAEYLAEVNGKEGDQEEGDDEEDAQGAIEWNFEDETDIDLEPLPETAKQDGGALSPVTSRGAVQGPGSLPPGAWTLLPAAWSGAPVRSILSSTGTLCARSGILLCRLLHQEPGQVIQSRRFGDKGDHKQQETVNEQPPQQQPQSQLQDKEEGLASEPAVQPVATPTAPGPERVEKRPATSAQDQQHAPSKRAKA